MRTFSSTVRCGNTAEIWNERTTPSRATSAGASVVMSCPLKEMRPRVGVRNLVSRLKQVVLPAPFGPISAWMVPRSTFRLTPLTATKPANSLVRSSVSRMISELMDATSPQWAIFHMFQEDRPDQTLQSEAAKDDDREGKSPARMLRSSQFCCHTTGGAKVDPPGGDM